MSLRIFLRFIVCNSASRLTGSYCFILPSFGVYLCDYVTVGAEGRGCIVIIDKKLHLSKSILRRLTVACSFKDVKQC